MERESGGVVNSGERPSAVTLDALGTIVRLKPPTPRLVRAMADRGIYISLGAAERAFAAEISFYRANHLRGSDAAGLESLRMSCAAVLREHLPPAVQARIGTAELQAAMLESLHFEEIPGAGEALRRLRERGLHLAVVSNWDVGLEDVLDGLCLRSLVDHVVTSAGIGFSKPDPRIFLAALRMMRVEASVAVHVGDSWDVDWLGARRAGMRALLVGARGNENDALESIVELPDLLESAS